MQRHEHTSEKCPPHRLHAGSHCNVWRSSVGLAVPSAIALPSLSLCGWDSLRGRPSWGLNTESSSAQWCNFMSQKKKKPSWRLTCVQFLVKLFYSVGRARFAIDALRVEAVHLHVLQHHFQHHRYRILFIEQVTHTHPEVLPGKLVIILWSHQTSGQSDLATIHPQNHTFFTTNESLCCYI